MTWHEAYMEQARSDYAVRQLLNRARVEYAHQLHYLQMFTEKFAKGFLTAPASPIPRRRRTPPL